MRRKKNFYFLEIHSILPKELKIKDLKAKFRVGATVSTAGRALVLHMDDPGSIPSTHMTSEHHQE